MEPEIPKIKYSFVCKIPSKSKYRSYNFNILGLGSYHKYGERRDYLSLVNQDLEISE